MKIKITGIIIMVIFAGTLIFYTCGKFFIVNIHIT